MSAVDRMVVRVRGAGYRSLPRRQALALIAAGRAEADKRDRLAEPPAPAPVVDVDQDQPAPNPYDLSAIAVPSGELDADDSAANADDAWDGSWQAERGPVVYPPVETVNVEITTAPETAKLLGIVGGSTELPPEPKPSARRGEWADYAGSLGVEVTSSMTKREIQTAAQEAAQSLSNLPQPALPGGRLETPEDEPAAETVADDQDPRTR